MIDMPDTDPREDVQSLLARIEELEARLEERDEMLDAIRRGEIDALVVNATPTDHRVYTLESADYPYRVLIEHIQEGAITLSTDGIVFYCNHRLAEMLGHKQERVIGQPLLDYIRSDEREAFRDLLGQALHGRVRAEFTICPLQAPDGVAEVPVYISLSVLARDDQEPLLCGVVADLTQQRLHVRDLSQANARLLQESAQREAAEEALRQSQKMEAVGQLTGGLAHDFNNLLTGIVGSLELIRTRVGQGRTGELGRYLDAAMGSANRASALTHRLLAFSRRQTLDPKLVQMNDLVAGMVELLRRTVGPTITVETRLAQPAGVILCDPNQLENALLNLAINARDAMPDGGLLTIATADMTLEPAFAAQRDMPPGDYVVVSVTDTGVGMPPEVVARAFDPFFTTKPLGQGTGLGLSMIYGFSRQSGGHVRLHSRPGAGTTASLYLPRRSETLTDPPAAAGNAPPPLAQRGETVLVVDDEPVVRMLVIDVLRDLGYAALEAIDGADGLRQLDSPRRIDLLITDVGLPGGMNGRQLADAARVRRPALKVLFITGFAEGSVLGNGALAPGMEMLPKPFPMDLLATRIRAMIGQAVAP